MDAERLRIIEELFHTARELSGAERDSFLERSCAGDEDLLCELESLLGTASSSSDFFETPPEALAADFILENRNRDFVGKQINQYKILSVLGIGGMGEVYLAEDTNLERQVALKFLDVEFGQRADNLDRFIREAKAASALNHPNILTVYEVGNCDGAHFIAAEFIDGKLLSRINLQERLSFESVLEIAIQIVSALQSAHEAGIVHRDIKPDNLMIRKDGIVKVLDFGLAKLTEKSDLGDSVSNSPKIAKRTTNPGMILGTPNYMSPEQARGSAIDHQTDIFSFGIVLFEMLSGKLPFQGETAIDVIAAILNKEPETFDEPGIPMEVEEIVFRCLKKDRSERYRTIGEVLTDLKNAKQEFDFQHRSEQSTASAMNEFKFLPGKQTTARGISQTTGRISTHFQRSRGRFGVTILILLAAFSVIGFFGYRYFREKKQIRSIAVMPFSNESGNADFDYLSDGMTEVLISSLSAIPNLSIKARSTVFSYKGKQTPVKKIGEDLNVDAVLLGQLVRRDDYLKLNLELVDAATQDVLWSENYSRKLDDLAALQSEIASDVADKLFFKLTAEIHDQVAKINTANSEAQQLYLKGRFYWNKRNVKDFEKAIDFFTRAIELDDKYAQAYSGLADTYALMPLYGSFRPTEYIPKAKKAALRAMELDRSLAEPHASLGYIANTYDFNWAGAKREYEHAIKLNPNYPTAHQWYAEHLAFKGMPDEALKEISKAIELDPLSLVINRMKGNILGFAGRYDESIDQLKKTIEMYPESAIVRFNLGEAYAAKGMRSEAVEQYLTAMKFDGKDPQELKKIKDAYNERGWDGFWTQYLDDLLKSSNDLLSQDGTAYYGKESIAYAYAATKNREKAIEHLTRAFEERDPGLITIRMSVVYDFLNDDPRYIELVRKIGLPD